MDRRKIKCNQQQSIMEDEEVESISLAYNHSKNLHFASADMRNIYMKNAQQSFENGNYLLSAYYQLESLCFVHNTINSIDYINLENDNFDFQLKNNNVKVEEHSNVLLDFAKKNYLPKEKCNNNNNSTKMKIFDPEKEIKNIISFIKILPNEWTVINICKGYNVNMTISTKEEILTSDIPIFLTIIKHPRSKEFPNIQPIIQLNIKDIIKGIYDIQKNFRNIIHFEDNGINKKEDYIKDLNKFDDQIGEQIKILSKTIGPWCCLLTGNVNNKDNKIQQDIFTKVDKFCDEFNLNDYNRILLSMLVPHVKYLTDNDIMEATKYLNKHDNSLLSIKINNFLINQKRETTYKYRLNPCILILDELLDHFPWEMLNKSQEICRIASFNILKQLFMKYKNKIINGYLHIEVKNGNCVINPDKNLNPMEKRMNIFFNYWLPNWNCICSNIPSEEQIKEIFSTDGVYVYCGHGSGMHFINNYKTGIKEIVKSVAFLFGCESVKLESHGLHAEFKGNHLYFHTALCPAIIGLIHVGLDFSLDFYATKILSTWIPSDNKKHWSSYDNNHWRTGKLIPLNNLQNRNSEYEPKLGAILCEIRSAKSQKMHDVVTLTYRGLPVWNSSI